MSSRIIQALFSLRFLRVVGLTIFAYIIINLDWSSFYEIITAVKFGYLITSVVLIFLYLVLRVIRLHLFLNINNQRISFQSCYKVSAESMIYASVTPAKMGELSKLGLLRVYDVPPSVAIYSILIERAYDFLLLLGLLVFGSLFFSFTLFSFDTLAIDYGLIVLAIVIVTTGLIYYARNKILFFSAKVLSLIRDKYALKERESEGRLLEILTRSWLPIGLMSTVILIVLVFQVYYLALSLGIEVSLGYIGFCYAATALVSLLPISIGGIGTREAVYIGLLVPVGISSEAAFALSILDGVVLAYLSILGFATPAFIGQWYKPRKVKAPR